MSRTACLEREPDPQTLPEASDDQHRQVDGAGIEGGADEVTDGGDDDGRLAPALPREPRRGQRPDRCCSRSIPNSSQGSGHFTVQQRQQHPTPRTHRKTGSSTSGLGVASSLAGPKRAKTRAAMPSEVSTVTRMATSVLRCIGSACPAWARWQESVLNVPYQWSGVMRVQRSTCQEDAAGEQLQALAAEAAVRRVCEQPRGLNLPRVHVREEALLEVGHACHAAGDAQLVAAQPHAELRTRGPQ